jgi:uncharacterized protein (TIGR00730 family)
MTEIKSVCVYCGSSSQVDQKYRDAAVELGRAMAERGVELVYGGGRVGLMGLIADACLGAGGRVTGIIPEFLERYEVGHGAVSELLVVESMHERKQLMAERSDGFLVLPGGFGTLDETFEILTWKQLKLHDKPIVVLNIDGFWTPLLTLIDHVIGQNFARPEMRQLLRVADGIEEAFAALNAAPSPNVGPEAKWM